MKRFVPVNIDQRTAGDLKALRLATSYSKGRMVSYSEILDELIASVRRSDPALYDTFEKIRGRGGEAPTR